MSNWFENLLAAQQRGAPGAILRFNTSDRVFAEDASKAMSLPYFLAAEFYARDCAVACLSLSCGLERLTPPGNTPIKHDIDAVSGVEDQVRLLQSLTDVLRTKADNSLVILIDYAEHIVPDAGHGNASGNEPLKLLEIVHRWSLDDEIRRSGNFVVLIERGACVHSLLLSQSRFEAVSIPLPDQSGRLDYIELILSLSADGLNARLDEGLDTRRFAQASSGLRLADIETLFREAAAKSSKVTLSNINARKSETIRELCDGLLEVVEPNPRGFEAVAGAYNAKAYFNSIKPLWEEGSPSLPKGVLLAGVPGTGKSFLIRSLAHEFKIPCVAMRSVREMWVGQSERNLEKVLSTLESLSPCLLWSDEVDQTMGQDRETQGGGDSGVSSRMLARFLEFTGDSALRGKILWIGTTNRPDLLDVATQDRFEVRLPFLHPRGRERLELWPELFRQLERTYEGDFTEIEVGDSRFDMLSARSLLELISLAGLFADIETGKPSSAIRPEHFTRALAEVEPEYDDGRVRRIAMTALLMTRWNLLLPWIAMGAPEAADVGWPDYLNDYVDPDTRRLRRDALAAATRAHK